MNRILSITMVVLALSLTGLAQAKSDFKGKGDGITTCPVTGEKITSKEVNGEFFGRTIYFCCPGCLDEVKKQPALFIKSTEKEQLAAVAALPGGGHGDHHNEVAAATPQDKFLGKGDGVETFPVSGEALTGMKVNGEFFGRVVYFGCEGCLASAKKNPELYVRKEAPKAKTASLGRSGGETTR